MGERKLASIQKIESLEPIEGRDFIELAHVLGWQVIVKKDQFKPGDLCIFVEPDALMPERPEFEFLRPKKFRIKTMKMGGVLSQGIIFPLDILPKEESYELGDDVTDALGIVKYDEYEEPEPKEDTRVKKKYPAFLMRWAWFRKLVLPTRKDARGFPRFISKTDEERVQNRPEVLNDKRIFAFTEKMDGCSLTAVLTKTRTWYGKQTYEFILCSRTLRLWHDDNNHYWKAAKRYNLPEVLKKMIGDSQWIAVQGECIGPKIQGNPYRLTNVDLMIFNIVLPEGRKTPMDTQALCMAYGLKPVPFLKCDTLPDTVNEMLDMATGESVVTPGVMREGLVLRSLDGEISFKAVSPDYLIKHGL